MNLMKLKWLWFGISGIVVIPGLISLLLFGLNLGIDFTGGTRIEEKLTGSPSNEAVVKSVEKAGFPVALVSKTSEGNYTIRTKPLDKEQVGRLRDTLRADLGTEENVRLETVGPTIGQEILQKAVIAIALASVFIVAYIAWSFRQVPKPARSYRFGLAAIAALLHDVLVVTGIFSILHVEVDSLFVTAILTVIGFSVHDTIVVFDRIRENLRRHPEKDFTTIANESLVQTLVRSLSTSLTVVLTLLAVLLLVGSVSEQLKWFVVALLVGIVSGTYSSIFNATPILVLWQEKRR